MNEICLSCRKHTKCGRAKHETIGCGYYVPMTNEEWFDTLSTEEKAETIAQLSSYGGNVEAILNWLKERHDGFM